jgi:glycosyl transferase family 25
MLNTNTKQSNIDKLQKNQTLSDYIPMIFYINLDHRTDRKEALEKELVELGIPYERFPAIKHDFGALGCSKSHLAVLKLAKQRNYPRVLILEDDFTFVVQHDNMEKVVKQIRDDSKPYDVCMISYNIVKSQDLTECYWKKVIESLTLSGYIVQEHYYNKLIEAIEPSIPLLEKTHIQNKYAVDVITKELQSNDKWYYTTERIGKQRPSYSDIEYKDVNYNV